MSMPVSPPDVDLVLDKALLHAAVSDPVLDTMNFLNEVTSSYPEAISFAPGRPYDGFFELDQVFGYLRRYLAHLAAAGQSPAALREGIFQYGPTAGRIRGIVAEALRRDEGVEVPPESIVVTVGCQEAMLLAVRTLIATPQDALLVSSPCYVGIVGVARMLDLEISPVPESRDGFRCAELVAAVEHERARGRRPRAFYLVPDHTNPLGSTIPLQTRYELLDLADRLDLLLLEDSPYRLVSPGRQLPSLKALDRRHRVVSLGSFAKSLFPGARVGYAVADQRVVDAAGRSTFLADEFSKIKSMVTVNTPSLSQAVVAGMLLAGGGQAATLNTRTAAYYASTMRATLEQLQALFPVERRAALGVDWNRPSGGFFLSVNVPFLADDAALVRSAREFGVLWTPMSYFYPGGGGEHAIRLSTSYLSQPDIVEGMARLARFIEAQASATVTTTKGDQA